MKFYTLSEINEQVSEDPAAFVTRCEDDLHLRLYACAEDIRRHMTERPILLVAGTAGSGRHSLLQRLGAILEGMGVRLRMLSLLDYYTSVGQPFAMQDPYAITELDSLACVNEALLRSQIRAMADREPVELPHFRFSARDDDASGEMFTRMPDELVVIYGTHVLNPTLLEDCMDCTSRLYISLRTRIVDGDAHLHPSLVRFARQWIRDRRTRGRDIIEMCDLFPSLVDAENQYIAPYKHMAHYELDAMLLYELCVYRSLMLEELCDASECPETPPEIITLKEFLCKISPIDVSIVPKHSQICELIGGADDE